MKKTNVNDNGKKETKPKKTPEERKKAVLRWVVDIIIIFFGATAYSIGLHCFSVPNDIVAGGVGGIATLINAVTGINVGILYGIINAPLIIVGFIFLGKKMMVKTFFAVAVMTVMTDYGLAAAPVYENGDRLLATVFAGIFFGAGLGVVYLREGTTGGTDIINKLINKKYPHFSLGAIMLGTDAVVIAASMLVYGNIESGLYAIIAIFICSKVMDMILYGSFEGKMLLIFSDKYHEISEYVMKSLNRGVTWLNATGAYSEKDKQVICCAVHKNEYSKIKRKVKEIDPHAFIIITNAGEVLGEGFHANQ